MRGIRVVGAVGGGRRVVGPAGALLVASGGHAAPPPTEPPADAGTARQRGTATTVAPGPGGLTGVPSELTADRCLHRPPSRPPAASPRPIPSCSGGPTPRRSPVVVKLDYDSVATYDGAIDGPRRDEPVGDRRGPDRATRPPSRVRGVHRRPRSGLRRRARRRRARGARSASRCAPSTAASRVVVPANRIDDAAGHPRRRRRAAGRAASSC